MPSSDLFERAEMTPAPDVVITRRGPGRPKGTNADHPEWKKLGRPAGSKNLTSSSTSSRKRQRQRNSKKKKSSNNSSTFDVLSNDDYKVYLFNASTYTITSVDVDMHRRVRHVELKSNSNFKSVLTSGASINVASRYADPNDEEYEPGEEGVYWDVFCMNSYTYNKVMKMPDAPKWME